MRERFRSYQSERKSHGLKRARARRDADRTRRDIETIVKRQLTREIAEGRFTGNLDAVRREQAKRVTRPARGWHASPAVLRVWWRC